MKNKSLLVLGAALNNPKLVIRKLRYGSKYLTQIFPEEIEKYMMGYGAIVEAGASDGEDTFRLSRRFPKHEYYAVEPVDEQFAFLRRKFSQNPEINLRKFAFGSIDGEGVIFIGQSPGDELDGMGSSSLLEPSLHREIFPEIEFSRSEKTQVFSLETFREFEGITLIDLLWLDLQGLEYEVLRAASKTLSEFVNCIHLELSNIELYRGAKNRRDIHRLLKQLGFKLRINRVGAISGNALYVRVK